MTAPSYHDLHITAPGIPRTSIFNLTHGLEVSCTRVTGWQLWQYPMNGSGRDDAKLVAGEYDGPEHWLILDVAGHVICDSRGPASYERLQEWVQERVQQRRRRWLRRRT